MKSAPVFLVALLLPVQAVAGAQYSAEDVIRYFERLNAATAEADPVEAPLISDSSLAPPAGQGVVIGEAPAGERPLAIPMTGAKAGYTVAPVRPASMRRGGYDLMVTFELESAKLTSQARQNLDAFAAALRSPALAKLRFAVEGHTDSSGSPVHNLELSEARAASVVAYLVGHDVQPERLTARGYGEARPRLADPAHPDNRRVETRRIE
jgi:outer membrane protein OmpA-like peptidoglycan-associated protein